MKKLFLLLAMAVAMPVVAQESAFTANHQKMALLPGDVSGVSIVDGDLYCYASQVLLVAQRSGDQLLGFWADTTIARMAEDVNYVVRHPATGDLYYTCFDRKGRSQLYCLHQREDGKAKVSRVKMGNLAVEHPTFTSNGRIMIFSAMDKRRGFGGYDLWYSFFEDGKWTHPVNLGGRLNTSYDEMTPSIYRDCLLFSSNGQDNDHAYLNIYASRLVALADSNLESGQMQIGRYRVQKLPAPLNSPDADDMDMIIDTNRDCGYWVSKRVESDTDSQLFSFSGALDGVLLTGRVTDQFNQLLEGVEVIARQEGVVVAHTITDEEGFYRLYLRCNQYYDIAYRMDGYFTENEQVNTTKADDEYLIAEAKRNVTLDRLLIGQRIYYEDIYGPGVSLELSEYGKERLEPLVRFLNDNPTMRVYLSLTSDITTEATFNRMLTENRLQALEEYLYRMLPPTVEVELNNGCAGESGCTSASEQTRLVVVVNEE